jgi:hypothetical protein
MFANQFGYKLEQLNSAIDTAEKHLNDLQGRILTSQEKSLTNPKDAHRGYKRYFWR